jgi:hypothetical protein
MVKLNGTDNLLFSGVKQEVRMYTSFTGWTGTP